MVITVASLVQRDQQCIQVHSVFFVIESLRSKPQSVCRVAERPVCLHQNWWAQSKNCLNLTFTTRLGLGLGLGY